jgi:hypothetical protein
VGVGEREALGELRPGWNANRGSLLRALPQAKFAMPDRCSAEKVALMKVYGAEVRGQPKGPVEVRARRGWLLLVSDPLPASGGL